jgi:glucokinase
MQQFAVGVDLGGTNLKAGLVDRQRGLVRPAKVKTEAQRGPEHVIGRLADLVEQLLDGVEAPAGIGVGSPGTIGLDLRTVTSPPNLPGWGRIDLAARLEDRFNLPVVVDNDANAAGLGSAFYGAGRPFESFIMVTLGTGVGGAIIHNKRLFRGAHGGAGELGHVSVDYEGPYARSGVAGAVEAYLGQQFLSHHARHHLLTRDSLLHEMTGRDLNGLTPRLLHEAASRGDEPAIEMLAWAGHKLGCALGSVINLLDIRKVVVGGGLAAAGDFLLDPARKALARFVMPNMAEGAEIIHESLGNEVALLGAARLAFEATDGAPTP